jgi:hypothetical protein
VATFTSGEGSGSVLNGFTLRNGRSDFNTKTVTVTIPSSVPAGVYYLLACADDTSAVNEVNEANNCLASVATVQVKAR